MVGTGILSNNMRSPSPEYYTTFWMMTIHSDLLHQSDITAILDPVTDHDCITEFDFLPNCARFPWNIATGAACQHRTLTPSENEINHPISSNSHPSATANKAIQSHK